MCNVGRGAGEGSEGRHGRVLRRTIVSDVVQGIIIGGVLGFLTFWILTNAYVTKVNGWTTILGCGEPAMASCSKPRAIKHLWVQ
jgi:hypothetical protein